MFSFYASTTRINEPDTIACRLLAYSIIALFQLYIYSYSNSPRQLLSSLETIIHPEALIAQHQIGGTRGLVLSRASTGSFLCRIWCHGDCFVLNFAVVTVFEDGKKTRPHASCAFGYCAVLSLADSAEGCKPPAFNWCAADNSQLSNDDSLTPHSPRVQVLTPGSGSHFRFRFSTLSTHHAHTTHHKSHITTHHTHNMAERRVTYHTLKMEVKEAPPKTYADFSPFGGSGKRFHLSPGDLDPTNSKSRAEHMNAYILYMYPRIDKADFEKLRLSSIESACRSISKTGLQSVGVLFFEYWVDQTIWANSCKFPLHVRLSLLTTV